MATYNFDLLDLADGECGDAAVSVVVSKKQTEAEAAAAAAKLAEASDDPAEQAAQEKATQLKYSYYARLQHDNGVTKCEHEMKRLKEVLIKLRAEEAKLKLQGGNEARVTKLVEEQRKLRQEQRKIRMEEAIILPRRDAFYKEHGIPLPGKNKKSQGEEADSGSNCDDANGNVSNNNDGSNSGGDNNQDQTKVLDDEKQVERGQDHYNNYNNGQYNNGGERRGYRQGQPRMKQRQVYRPVVKSDAGTEADGKPEEKAVSASETEQKEVSADNSNAVPASVSENSAGGAAQNGSSNGQGKGTFRKVLVNGSEKRKKRNSKKNNGNEPEKAKKQDSEVDKQPLTGNLKEEEKKTLAEYEKIREEKKKPSEALKTEVRKVTAEEFNGFKVLEKKLDDEEAVIKVEKAQPKVKVASKKKEKAQTKVEEASKKEETEETDGKEAATKDDGKEAATKDDGKEAATKDDGKDVGTKDGKSKKVIIPLGDLSFRQPPRRVYDQYDQEDGSSVRGRFNGGFQGGSRDSSTEPRVSGRGGNGRAAQNEAGFHNGNGAPRGAYNGRGNGAPRGDYYGRRDEYRGNGGYGRGNGDYQGNGYQQQQGGNVGRFQQQRAGNGGYYRQQQDGQRQRRYQQRGNSGFRRDSAPAPNLAVEFPALPAPASARAAPAPDSAPATAPAPSPASAPAPAQA